MWQSPSRDLGFVAAQLEYEDEDVEETARDEPQEQEEETSRPSMQTNDSTEPPAKRAPGTPTRATPEKRTRAMQAPALEANARQDEGAADAANFDKLPDVRDASAKKPILGQPQLTPQAIRMRTQRIFTRRANGQAKVSEEIFQEWHSKGPRRDLLVQIFGQCGYDPAGH